MLLLLLPGVSAQAQRTSAPPTQTTAQWDVFEVSFNGPTSGAPFVDVQLSAIFEQGGKQVPVGGFYDGDGICRARDETRTKIEKNCRK